MKTCLYVTAMHGSRPGSRGPVRVCASSCKVARVKARRQLPGRKVIVSKCYRSLSAS